jgi:phosphatidylglycerophosphate synthase
VTTDAEAPCAWILARAGETATGAATIWGLAPEERLARGFVRAGCAAVHRGSTAPATNAGVIVCRGDLVLDERLIEGITGCANAVLCLDVLGPVAAHVRADRALAAAAVLRGEAPADSIAGTRRVAAEDVTSFYLPKLRKLEAPFAYPLTPERAREIEWKTFGASYKGLTDLVTKWVWPRPAAAVTRWCAEHRITPNSVTILSWILAIETVWLFAEAHFGWGLLVAWLMTFLDTVDGKLARVTLTSSRLGDVLDHGLDLLHPPFWWFAWAVGVGMEGSLAAGIAVGGYVVGRLLEGAFLALFEFETHSWRPIDGLVRTITARRNPNLILFTVATLAGRPDLGLVMVAGWTAISLAFHALALLQALRVRARGGVVKPWDDVSPVAEIRS